MDVYGLAARKLRSITRQSENKRNENVRYDEWWTRKHVEWKKESESAKRDKMRYDEEQTLPTLMPAIKNPLFFEWASVSVCNRTQHKQVNKSRFFGHFIEWKKRALTHSLSSSSLFVIWAKWGAIKFAPQCYNSRPHHH